MSRGKRSKCKAERTNHWLWETDASGTRLPKRASRQLSSCSSSSPTSSSTTMLSRRILPQINRSVRAATRSLSTAPKSVEAKVPAEQDESKPVSTWQSPNYPTTWSTSQNPRPLAGSSPRFEQTYMDLQPQPLSAMELIAQEPIRLVQGRKAVCDGGQCFNFELALPGKRYGGVSKLPETS